MGSSPQIGLSGHASPRRGQGCSLGLAERPCENCRGDGCDRDARGARTDWGAIPAGGAWGAWSGPHGRGAQAAGKGCSCPGRWYRLAGPKREREEPWPAVSSALAPTSVPGLRGLGPVPTSRVEGFGEHKSLKTLGRRGGWELPWWPRHGPFWLLAAKDSLASPRKECGGSLCSAPAPPPPPKSLPSSSWGGKGLREAGGPLGPRGGSRGLWVPILLAFNSIFPVGEKEQVDSAEPRGDQAEATASLWQVANAFVTIGRASVRCLGWSAAEIGERALRARRKVPRCHSVACFPPALAQGVLSGLLVTRS